MGADRLIERKSDGSYGYRWAENKFSLTMITPLKSSRNGRHVDIKKVLKEKGIRFQTPPTKIRIHLNNGVRTYREMMEKWEIHGGKRLHRGRASHSTP